MKKIVICGGGPIGLYLAVSLKKAGAKNIVVFDPRAGDYRRPGHLNASQFSKTEERLKISRWKKPKANHLKDYEKILFAEAISLGITIENKKFITFNQVDGKKGVLVRDTDSNETLVECDFAFDCTGGERVLVHAVNQLFPDTPPFQITKIVPNIEITKHFLAFVKLSEADLNKLPSTDGMKDFSTEDFIAYMERFRALGWTQMSFPSCYGMYFEKDKTCLYMEHPDRLNSEDHEAWVQLVLEAKTGDKTVKFEQLPKPKKVDKKPRFMSFTADPDVLSPLSFQTKGFPTVIPLGDSQIGAHHRLAHGIRDGINRVNSFIDHIDIIDGNIWYFDGEEFANAIKINLTKHTADIIRHYKTRHERFESDLYGAIFNYTVASSSDELKALYPVEKTLEELHARSAYIEALKILGTLNNDKAKATHTLARQNSLEAAVTKLSLAMHTLPALFAKEKADAKDQLITLALDWKNIGNGFFKSSDYESALNAYQHALNIYEDINDINLALQELTIVSNMVLTYNKLDTSIRGLILATETLQKMGDAPELSKIKDKIVFNLAGIVAKERENVSSINSTEDRHERTQAIVDLITRCQPHANESLKVKFNTELNLLQDLLNDGRLAVAVAS